MKEAWRQQKDDVLLEIRVQPKASRNDWHLEADGRLRVALMAPPVDGKANAALLAYLAKVLAVRKGALRLEQGEKSRDKTIRIERESLETVRRIFQHHDD